MIGRRRFLAGTLAFAASGASAHARSAGSRRLPDGEVTAFGACRAWLVDPTKRYDHAILGDDIEAGGFVVECGGRRFAYRLAADAVFEDRRVRLIDLDGDGKPTALVVKSYLTRGSALALYRIGVDRIEAIAESAPPGKPYRWLNPVGYADFTGSGERMFAAVVTPHVAGSLRLFRLAGDRLDEAARFDGVTNHILGTRNLDLARIVPAQGGGPPDIVLPSQDRRSLVRVSFAGGKPGIVSSVPAKGPIRAVSAPRDGKVRVECENGEAFARPV